MVAGFLALAIGDRDLVVVDQVFADHAEERLVAKRLPRVDDRWHLESANPAHASRAVACRARVLAAGGVAGSTRRRLDEVAVSQDAASLDLMPRLRPR